MTVLPLPARAPAAFGAMRRIARCTVVGAWLCLAAVAAPALAAGCEELQQTVEARIRANGVASFTVTTVDAAASAPGQVVGSCDQGRKKLLYVRGTATPSAAAAKPMSAASGVITECADGRVITEGTCKQ